VVAVETVSTDEAACEHAETLDILGDDDTLADLRQSREDFAGGDTFDVTQVQTELERVRSRAAG
jgi:antitoxin YefM